MSDIQMKISIPADTDGYILLQCQICGEFFKLTVEDIGDDNILQCYCPSCGLVSDNYFTDDVEELAMAMGSNIMGNLINDTFKQWEKKFNNSFFSFKSTPIKMKFENPIYSSIEALEKGFYTCCSKYAKIKLILKMSASTCPFCGVKNYEVE